jgi:hypothetical protein
MAKMQLLAADSSSNARIMSRQRWADMSDSDDGDDLVIPEQRVTLEPHDLDSDFSESGTMRSSSDSCADMETPGRSAETTGTPRKRAGSSADLADHCAKTPSRCAQTLYGTARVCVDLSLSERSVKTPGRRSSFCADGCADEVETEPTDAGSCAASSLATAQEDDFEHLERVKRRERKKAQQQKKKLLIKEQRAHVAAKAMENGAPVRVWRHHATRRAKSVVAFQLCVADQLVCAEQFAVADQFAAADPFAVAHAWNSEVAFSM